MGFVLIKGTFYVKGYSPDGDSIRFKADNREHWTLLKGTRVRPNSRGHVQLRLEAIDTLETHYKNHHQPKSFAIGALKSLLEKLQIQQYIWDEMSNSIKDADDGKKGYILSRTTDKFGRPVCFVFSGDSNNTDGKSIFLNEAILFHSINYAMLAEGLAYPTFYFGLFYDLRNAMIAATKKARNQKIGIWTEDKTNTGFAITNITDLTDQHVILPKLFRRLVAYLQGGTDLSGFKAFLEAGDEQVFLLGDNHFTKLDNLVEVNGNKVKMIELPEDVVYKP